MLCLISLQEEKEGEDSDTEEQVPEATERKEHSSCGQTGVENMQSEQAVELAGAAPEKEAGKEVRGCQLPKESRFFLSEITVAGLHVMFVLVDI